MNAKTFHMNDYALRSLCESVADRKLSGQPIDELLRLEIDTLSDDQVEKLHQFTEGAMYAGRNLDRWRHEPAEIMPSFLEANSWWKTEWKFALGGAGFAVLILLLLACITLAGGPQ